jgi:hypothetical protein
MANRAANVGMAVRNRRVPRCNQNHSMTGRDSRDTCDKCERRKESCHRTLTGSCVRLITERRQTIGITYSLMNQQLPFPVSAARTGMMRAVATGWVDGKHLRAVVTAATIVKSCCSSTMVRGLVACLLTHRLEIENFVGEVR